MAEAVLAVVALLVLAVGVAALRAVLDGRRSGTPASIAVLGPLSEAARLLRERSGGSVPVLAGALLLVAAVARGIVPVLVGPLGLGAFVAADVVWWIGGLLLAERRGRFLLGALAVEVPLVLALAAPAVAARSTRLSDVVAAERTLPFAAEAPVAFLLVLVIGGVLLPWAIRVDRRRGGGRLLIGAGLAAQPVSAAAAATLLFVGIGGGWGVVATAVLAAALVLLARRLPALRLGRVVRPALVVLLPLAVVQLAVVVALTVLAG